MRSARAVRRIEPDTDCCCGGTFVLAAVLRDLTDRQRAERELKRSNQQLQALSAALQQVREQERARIARELHDELGQALTGIRMEVSWLGGRLSADQQALIDKLATLKGFIDQTIAAVRRIASELRPLVLDDLGFGAAAHWYVDQFAARTDGLRVALNLCEREPRPGDAVATAFVSRLARSTDQCRAPCAGERSAGQPAPHRQCLAPDDQRRWRRGDRE